MLKRIFFAVVTALALCSCNTDLDPEYTTEPQFGITNFSVNAEGGLDVAATITNPYGLNSAWIVYFPDGDVQQPGKTTKPYYFKGEADKDVIYKGVVPKQTGPLFIKFYVVAVSPFSTYGVSKFMEYTFPEDPTPLPDPEPSPESATDLI